MGDYQKELYEIERVDFQRRAYIQSPVNNDPARISITFQNQGTTPTYVGVGLKGIKTGGFVLAGFGDTITFNDPDDRGIPGGEFELWSDDAFGQTVIVTTRCMTEREV
jgi:hypothetical protein